MKKRFKQISVAQRFSILRTAVALGIALLLALVLIVAISEQPLEDIVVFLFGPIMETSYLESMLTRMVPLCFTGIAVCIMCAGGQLNLGAEGAFFAGAVGCTCVAILPGIPPVLHPILCMLAGGLVGAFFCGICGVLSEKFNVMTVVSSLMMNYVALNLGLYILLSYLLDTSAGFRASYKFADSAKFSKMMPGSSIHSGFIIVIVAILLCHVLLNKSTYGYAIHMVGQNSRFARYSGINVTGVVIGTQLLGGFLAGLGSSVELLGMYSRFTYNGLTGHGWDGVMIAVMAKNNPKNVPLAVLFLSYLRTSADVLNKTSAIPNDVIKIVQAVVIIFIAAQSLFSRWEYRSTLKNAGVLQDTDAAVGKADT